MIIASYMKLAYRTWNREHYVNDEIIKGDLEKLSEGALVLGEDEVIDVSAVKYTRTNTSSSNNHRRRKGGGRNNKHSNNNRRRGSNKSNRRRH